MRNSWKVSGGLWRIWKLDKVAIRLHFVVLHIQFTNKSSFFKIDSSFSSVFLTLMNIDLNLNNIRGGL